MIQRSTLDEIMTELIQQEGWYANSGYDRKTAYSDKQKFLEGKLQDKRKREYVSAAGYKKIQEELWTKKID